MTDLSRWKKTGSSPGCVYSFGQELFMLLVQVQVVPYNKPVFWLFFYSFWILLDENVIMIDYSDANERSEPLVFLC